MCGIAGYYRKEVQHKTDYLDTMLNGIRHRGPDGVGKFEIGQVGLLHARLSIIDVSERGSQPLYNEDKTIVLVCNGELYNYGFLRKDLEKKGHIFFSHSDSEVLVHLYEELQEDLPALLRQLHGMFAFALYDTRKKRLILARDRFGIKPLYLNKNSKGLFFASEIQSIADVLTTGEKSVDYTSLSEYFQFLSIPEPNTIFNNVKCLPAGHYLVADENSLSVHEYYNLTATSWAYQGTYQDYQAELVDLMKAVVEDHLVADVPVGSFLSAGIDSTVVTHLAAASAKDRFVSVTAAFPGFGEDETSIACRTASLLGIRHVSKTMTSEFAESIEQASVFFDQPFGVSSSYSLFKISELARKEMKVVLTGDGGDEVFGGYDHKHIPFFKPRILKYVPSVFDSSIGRALQMTKHPKLYGLGQQMRISDAERFLNRSRVLSAEAALTLLHRDKHSDIDHDRFKNQIAEHLKAAEDMSWLHRLLYADINSFLKSEMLYKCDRMTMANGIEGRVPFLDHRLVEFAFQAKPEWLRHSEAGKQPLRQFVDKHYTGLGTRKKTGFNTPVASLLRDQRTTFDKLLNKLSQLQLIDGMAAKQIAGRNDRHYADLFMLTVGLNSWGQKNIH